MKFTIDVDINIDEISQAVANKAEKEAFALVDAKCQKRIDQIMQEYRPITDKLKQYAEERMKIYINNLMDDMFDMKWTYWGAREERTKKLKEYLGDHLADRVENIMDNVDFNSEELEGRIVQAVADRLTGQTRMTKPVVKRLAEEIVRIQDETKECDK